MREALILASASPRRLDLLAQIGIAPEKTVPADIDETPRKGERARAYAARIALEKARKVSGLHPGKLVLAADTVVAVGRRILPKPASEEEVSECLRLLSGRRHRVTTGLALITSEGKETVRLCETAVKFKRMSPEETRDYIATGAWRGMAGGYALQGVAAKFITWIGGSPSNVIGLPLHEVARMLEKAK